MNITTIFRPMTVTQFQDLVEQGIFIKEARLELIDGRIHEMSSISLEHLAIGRRLLAYMPQYLGVNYTYTAQSPAQILTDFQPLPDYLVLRRREDFYEEALPTAEDILLLVEVSDTTLVEDLTVKLPRYAQAGVPEVWIIDVNRRSITQFHTLVEGHYTHQAGHTREDTILTMLGVEVAVKEIVG
jgi:Uma2 family endonuclease